MGQRAEIQGQGIVLHISKRFKKELENPSKKLKKKFEKNKTEQNESQGEDTNSAVHKFGKEFEKKMFSLHGITMQIR